MRLNLLGKEPRVLWSSKNNLVSSASLWSVPAEKADDCLRTLPHLQITACVMSWRYSIAWCPRTKSCTFVLQSTHSAGSFEHVAKMSRLSDPKPAVPPVRFRYPIGVSGSHVFLLGVQAHQVKVSCNYKMFSFENLWISCWVVCFVKKKTNVTCLICSLSPHCQACLRCRRPRYRTTRRRLPPPRAASRTLRTRRPSKYAR